MARAALAATLTAATLTAATLRAQVRDDARDCGTPAAGERAIAVALRDATLDDALARLAAASGARLVWSRDLLPRDRRVTLRCAATTLDHALRAVLAGSGFAAVRRPDGLVIVAPSPSADAGAPPLARADRPFELPRVATTADGDRALLRPAAVPPPNPGASRTVVSAAELAATGAVQLGEALRTLVPGIATWETGMPGAGLRVAGVRGASSIGGPSLKVYVDGVEVASGTNLAALDARDVERLEVLRGPAAAALHGADAIDGVLLVTTRAARDAPPRRLRVQGAFRSGAAATAFAGAPAPMGDATLAIEQRLPLGAARDAPADAGVAWSVAGNAAHAGAVTPTARADAAGARATLRAWHGTRSAEVTARLGESRASPALRASAVVATRGPVVGGRDTIAPSRDSFDFTAARERLSQRTVGLTLRAAGRRATHALVLGVDRFRTATDSGGTIVRGAPDSARWAWPGTTTRLGARWATQLALRDAPAGALSLAVGAEAARLRQEGPLVALVALVGAPRRDTTLVRDLAAATLALTARHGAGLTWQAGLRAERDDAVGRDVGLAWLPSAGVAWERALAGPWRLRLRAGAGTAVRTPPPLAAIGRRAAGGIEQRANPALGPERQRGVEATAELLAGDGASFAVTRYVQRVDGLLQLVTTDTLVRDSVSARRVVQYQQIGRIANDGWEFAARARLAGWRAQASLALVPSRVVALAPGYTGPLGVGDQMLDAPVRSGALVAARDVGRATVAAGLTYTGPWRGTAWRCTVGAGGAGNCVAETRLRDFAGITRSWVSLAVPLRERLALQLRAENLGGTQRGEGNEVLVAPGRTFLLGVTLRP